MAAAANSPKVPANPFWDFSLAVYGMEGVAAACLRLQDRHQLDVNILLFAVWWAQAGHGRLSRDQFTAVLEKVGEWHQDAVGRLRAIRNDLKTDSRQAPAEHVDALRDQVKAAELFAERTEQLMLFQLASDVSSELSSVEAAAPAADARESAETYLHVLGRAPAPADAADIAIIVSAAFGRDKND